MGRLVGAGIGATVVIAIVGVGLSMAGVPMEYVMWIVVILFLIFFVIIAWAGIQVGRGKKSIFD